MLRLTEVELPLDYTEQTLRSAAARRLKLPETAVKTVRLVRRAVDARKKERLVFCCTLDVSVADETAVLRRKLPRVQALPPPQPQLVYRVTPPSVRPVVVGAGPAGLFAALTLAKAGLRPLLLERGRNVEARQQDVERFRETGVLDPDSNVQFGEGGAGTFSDGKLTTGIKDPRCRRVLETLAAAGAPEDILWQAKPHVGTDELRKTVAGLRRAIEAAGGEVKFECKVTELVTKNGDLVAIRYENQGVTSEIPCRKMILAIGHSARDTVAHLHEIGVPMEPKSFAVGVRIEHLRRKIDESQYGRFAGHPALGAADYKLACHLPGGRDVYTFCMCPGGVVIAAASEPNMLAVNGMSERARAADNSNSALLVGVGPADFPSAHPLAGIELQREMERAAFRLGGGGYRAPAQTVEDFLHDRPSTGFGAVTPSYRPGVTPADLRGCLPSPVSAALKEALPLFGRRLKGFDTPEAVLTGVESRSSSPVRIRRDQQGQSAVRGVFPCGEGAGYAGGITSAAVDGIRCAEWLIQSIEE